MGAAKRRPPKTAPQGQRLLFACQKPNSVPNLPVSHSACCPLPAQSPPPPNHPPALALPQHRPSSTPPPTQAPTSFETAVCPNQSPSPRGHVVSGLGGPATGRHGNPRSRPERYLGAHFVMLLPRPHCLVPPNQAASAHPSRPRFESSFMPHPPAHIPIGLTPLPARPRALRRIGSGQRPPPFPRAPHLPLSVMPNTA